MMNKHNSTIFLLIMFIIGTSFGEDNEDKYYFQLYPSLDTNRPHYFYAQTNYKLLTINATEGENCDIISRTSNDEFTYKNISSIITINDSYLVKTCFLSDKLVEITYEGISFTFKNNLENIKFCYSTQILNPSINSAHNEKYVIITYFTELILGEKYSHKAIIFYPSNNKFSGEITLLSDSSFINDYYPENCITFRNTDIYCSIHFTGSSLFNVNLLRNNYVIETKKLFFNEENIFLVLSNSITSTSNYYKKLIPLNRIEKTFILTKLKDGIKDIFLTECHNQKDSIKTWIRFSHYINDIHKSYISVSGDYGIKISDKYINPKLLNYLIPNEKEMLIIYITEDKRTNLLISRFKTEDIDINYSGYVLNNYFRTDICSKPKFMQSKYIKSFIKYEQKDKNYMENNPSNNYYKYEKDIGIVISCEEKDVTYQTLKVEIPQCLNDLDEINGNDFHILRFTKDKYEIIFDIYNNPNLISFRKSLVKIIKSSSLENMLQFITIKIKEEGKSDYVIFDLDQNYKNVTHIKFVKTPGAHLNYSFKLDYTIQNTGKDNDEIVNAMKSDICHLEIHLENSEEEKEKCSVPYCDLCESENENICKLCNFNITGLILDTDINSETYGKCICDDSKGFQKSPQIDKMCICKEGYSFYNDINLCNKTEDLNNGSYFVNHIEEKSNISIYKDCHKECKKCMKGEQDELICMECNEGYYLKNGECLKQECNTGEWFKFDNYVFNYLKIEECIFIFYVDDLFLISDEEICKPFMNGFNYNIITSCLNNSNINLTKFIDIENVYKYSSTSKDIIAEKYSEDGIYHFHLIKYESTKEKDISGLEIISKNNEMENINYLIFKVDIKRNDTISTQVVYQLYEPEKNKINEKIYLDENNTTVLLSLPIAWREGQLDKIKELSNKNIDAFDSSSPFYIDVCNKFTNSKHDDVFLEDRKKDYYPNEAFCEKGCQFDKFDKITEKIICKCKFKNNMDTFKNVTFDYNKKDVKFEKEISFPNLAVMRCSSVVSKCLGKNFGFFLTFFLLIIFLASIIHGYINGEGDLNEKLRYIKKTILGENDLSQKNSFQGSCWCICWDCFKEKSTETLAEPEKVQENQLDNQIEENSINENQGIKNLDDADTINDNDKNSSNNDGVNIINIKTRNIKNEKENIISSSDNNTIRSDTTNKNDNNKEEDEKDTNGDINNEYINNTNNSNINNTSSNENENNGPKNENNSNNGNENNIGKNDNDETKSYNEKKSDEGKKSDGEKKIDDGKKSDDEIKRDEGKIDDEKKSDDEKKIDDGKKSDTSGNKENPEIMIIKPGKKYREDLIEQSNETKSEAFNKIEYSRDSDINNFEEVKKEETEVKSSEKYPYIVKKETETDKKEDISLQVAVKLDININKGNIEIKSDIGKNKKKTNKKESDKPNPPGKMLKKANNELMGSTEPIIESKEIKEYTIDDYNLDKMKYQDIKTRVKKDKRNIYKMLLSIILNNSTIYLLFSTFEVISVKITIVILFISLHLFLNTLFLVNMQMVKIYLGCFKFGNFILTIFLTSVIVNVVIIIIKQNMTCTNFIHKINYDYENKNKNNENNEKDLDHILTKTIVPYKKNFRNKIMIYGISGFFFLLFNCIVVTSFCGIYSNSVGELILNTFVCIILSSIVVRLIFYSIGVILRYYSFKNDSEILYNISRLFNPLHVSLNEFEEIVCGIYNTCEKNTNNKNQNFKDKPEEIK